MDHSLVFMIGTLLVVGAPIAILRIWSSWGASSRLNSTAEWTPPSPYHPPLEKPPVGSAWVEFDPLIITPHLEAGETVEGFGHAFFTPARYTDWKYGPHLLVAATSRRILLFEVQVWTVLRHCFIPHDDLSSVRPPKKGLWGSTGRVRIGLKSGMEYQMTFYSPLFNEEAMRQERRLAAYLSRLAWRFVSVRDLRTGEIEKAA